jgi:serine protease AprX
MMKQVLTFTIIFLTGFTAFAQDRYVVFFTDKNNTPYSVSNPSAYLSQRAIARRTAQNISITNHDFPVNPAYVSGVASTGAVVRNSSRWFNAVIVTAANNGIINSINALPYVANVIQVGRMIPGKSSEKLEVQPVERSVVNTSKSSSKVAAFSYGQSLNQVAMLKGDQMHNNGFTGAGMVIAVIDAGFSNVDNMPAFDSLRAANRILSTWDFVENEANVYNDHHHGTMVLSVMGAHVPGEIVGTAPHASYLLLRSEDAPTEKIVEEYYWACAAEYADSSGADIINSSLGYTRFDDPSQDHQYTDLNGDITPVTRAADFAASKGMVVCNSAGNEGNGSWFHISAPADADSILAVGAVDAMMNYVQFSGKGPSSDGRVKPDVAAQGAATIVSDPWTGTGAFGANGTSFSSPLIAGMIATLWQCHPGATNMQIINAVRMSAHQASSPDSLLGYGIPDFPVACMLLSGLNPVNFSNGDQLVINGNPVGNDLNFSFYTTVSQNITVRIYDILGRPIFKQTLSAAGYSNNSYSIPFTYAKGNYVIEVESEEKVIRKKIMRQ